jgi:sterol desaturase/sphingolipid hydroxylase (fatty acid hydroxylase superfamily)
MLQIIWDTRGYFFWLLVVSALCLILERIHPWRARQRLFRRQFAQDLFWLFFNGHYLGILLAYVSAFGLGWAFPFLDRAKSPRLLAATPLIVQFVVFFVIKDLFEWAIHNLLHRAPWLWEFHKLHHSIEEMDWIGNFRFHWMEVIVYQSLLYFPLAVMGVDARVVLAIAVVSTLIGHLNHSNLRLSWGPLRYLLNSPRMHVWHHDHDWPADRPRGVNFGVCLSTWDWLFGTAYWPTEMHGEPAEQPARLGFHGIEQFPRSLIGRFCYPLTRWLPRHRAAFTVPDAEPVAQQARSGAR